MGEIFRLKQEKEYRDECLTILKEAQTSNAELQQRINELIGQFSDEMT